MGDLETLDHQSVEATDSESVQNSESTIATFFTSHQHLSARNALWIRQRFLNDEQTSQRNGEHRAKETTQCSDDEGLKPLDVGPNVHHQQGRHGKDDTSGQRFTSRRHGLDGVVFENGDVLEQCPEDNHGHDGCWNAGRDRHPCVEAEVGVCRRH